MAGSTRLVCVRHGRQIPTSARTADNMRDPPLAEIGLQQAHDRAEQLRESLQGVAPVVVVSSPMLRALQTAAPIAKAVGTAPLHSHGACFEFGCAGLEFGGGAAAVQQACPDATLSHFGPRGEWDYRGSSSKETEPEAKQRAGRVARWLQDECLPQAEGGAVVLVAHATFLDLLLQLLVDGTDAGWEYGAAKFAFGHAGTRTIAATLGGACAAGFTFAEVPARCPTDIR